MLLKTALFFCTKEYISVFFALIANRESILRTIKCYSQNTSIADWCHFLKFRDHPWIKKYLYNTSDILVNVSLLSFESHIKNIYLSKIGHLNSNCFVPYFVTKSFDKDKIVVCAVVRSCTANVLDRYDRIPCNASV